MDRSIKDIPSLIKWIADKHHNGAASAMSVRLGVSVSTPSFWRRGVALPNHENCERICAVYGLDPDQVWELVRASMRRRADRSWGLARPSMLRRKRRHPIAGGSGVVDITIPGCLGSAWNPEGAIEKVTNKSVTYGLPFIRRWLAMLPTIWWPEVGLAVGAYA